MIRKLNKIVPEKDLYSILPHVVMPGRYVGGEYGIHRKTDGTIFNTAISFPDLYEIGMSNTAVKLVYRYMNEIPDVVCDRVFAPAGDFEERLRCNNIPLYTLENGIPLNELDLLGFSIGYELCITNVLLIMDLGRIPLLSKERSETDPIVIAGGPAVTNPAPFGIFFDAVYIGECEDGFISCIRKMKELKRKGASRYELLEELKSLHSVWSRDKNEKVVRAVNKEFSKPDTGIRPDAAVIYPEAGTDRFPEDNNDHNSGKTLLPVSSIKSIQDHGVVEIMRGCPNGCRFCHAGYIYRPWRRKTIPALVEEVDHLVSGAGYREITLSSLSTGDYEGLQQLITILNDRYENSGVSFSLPSLRVNSFTLSLLEGLSRVRKSGLTFAVETPVGLWQKGINKEVPVEKVIEILNEARNKGWKNAKFYFMVGLPVSESSENEEKNEIIRYIEEIKRSVKIHLNINIGTFIPKPHTPFQWDRQLTEIESSKILWELKKELSRTGSKVSYHSPFLSFLEGIISRGDERVGDLILSAYNKGARFDAWEEHMQEDVWRSVFSEADWNIEDSICSKKSFDDILPWDGVDIGAGKGFFKSERIKCGDHVLTEACADPCEAPCGVCSRIPGLIETAGVDEEIRVLGKSPKFFVYKNRHLEKKTTSLLFLFSKSGKARYLSHINIMTIFERAFLRSGLDIVHTEGYNPKPKIEFAHPLSLGINSDCEIASVVLNCEISKEEFLEKAYGNFPHGIEVSKAAVMNVVAAGVRRKSLMASFGGSKFLIFPESPDLIKNLSETASKLMLKDSEFSLKATSEINGSEVFVGNTGTKEGNLMFLVSNFISKEDFLSKYRVTRIKMYANNEGILTDYFTMYT